jgi:hypothetical protein
MPVEDVVTNLIGFLEENFLLIRRKAIMGFLLITFPTRKCNVEEIRLPAYRPRNDMIKRKVVGLNEAILTRPLIVTANNT